MLSPWIFWQSILIGIFLAGETIYNGPEQLSPEIGELPYMVRIVEVNSDSIITCGGAIIDSIHILTAAHCLIRFSKDRLIIIAGTVDSYSEARIQQDGAAEFFIHKKFAIDGTLWYQIQSTRWDRIRKWFLGTFRHSRSEVNIGTQLLAYDIGVIKLNRALPIGDNVKPVNLPSPDSSPVCYLCTFAGWGRVEINGTASRHLYATELVVLSPPECEARFATLPSNEFCAIHPNAESMPLKGDSGSPLVIDNIVYGVASRIRRNDPRYPSVFTKVSAHLKWIRKVLKK